MTKKCKYQGFIELNGKRYLFIPKNEKLEISNCCVDGIICDSKDYNRNIEKIKTLNQGCDPYEVLFLDKATKLKDLQ